VNSVPPADLSLRPATAADRPFLLALFATTSAVAHAPLPPAQRDALLAMQFDARERSHGTHFPDARSDVIERSGEAIGRIVVARDATSLRLVDLVLAPASRGRGIGTALVTLLQAEAAQGGRRVQLYVARDNPALRLYGRLGFRVVAEDAIGFAMEWVAP
jgi:ribosomal protein S18 acetylase RimI-like enzyme